MNGEPENTLHTRHVGGKKRSWDEQVKNLKGLNELMILIIIAIFYKELFLKFSKSFSQNSSPVNSV